MAKKPHFALVYADEVKQHLQAIETKYHSGIRTEVEAQLLFQPNAETRNRKPLKRPIAFGAYWELRLGPDNRSRVFYQVNAASREVRVLAVGVKDRNRLLIGGEEFEGRGISSGRPRVMDEKLLITYGFPALGGLLALLFLFLALRAGRHQRLVSDLPTSKTTGVFIGLVELKGTAEAEQPLISYLAEQSCVYYQWQVDEQWSRVVTETYTDSEGRTQTRTRIESGSTTVAQGGDQIPFYLQDDCGIIRIQPEKAKVEPRTTFDYLCGPSESLYYAKGPAGAVANSTYSRRFVEHAIPLHIPLYVVGQARERDDVVAPEIAHAPHAEKFLISTRSEEQVRRGLAWQFWLIGLLGVAFGAGGFIVRDASQHRPIADNVPLYVVAGSVSVVAWLLAWIGMVYNSIVTLRQRVQQAWANVDVQLKRRHDLIPNLVNIVRGMHNYEQTLQTELAQLRNQLVATAPGEPGPDPRATTMVLRAIQERYPDLKANSSFLNLHRNLVDTEERIALARGYFNDIATFYNDRLQTVPDRFIAALGSMKPRVLMTADDFERAPVEVNFAN